MLPDPVHPERGSFVRDQVAALRRLDTLDVELYEFPPGASALARAALDLRRRFAHRPRRFDVVHSHFGLTAWPALGVRAHVRALTVHGTDLRHPRTRLATRAVLPLIDLLATVDGNQTDLAALAAAARGQGIRVADDDTWTDIFSRVLLERIEPNLGMGRATVLDEYPTCEAALARPTMRDPRVAERFELYVCGVEIANAFGELTDPAEQRRRFDSEMAEKLRVHGESYPIDEDFLAALARMPPACGIALGFDRLAMLATGAQRIEQVLWTPVAE